MTSRRYKVFYHEGYQRTCIICIWRKPFSCGHHLYLPARHD